ncbi:MAG TPA: hypothetical protein VFE22_05405, partial [Edaphobacter sp.]|nr:hypothetical protein [Edaphobacter sp.]
HTREALICFSGIPEDRIAIHQNPTDLERFPRRTPLPAVPRRALVLSNAISHANSLSAIERACRRSGLSLDTVGLSMGTARLDTESILGDHDIVFATGRSALDALATGCAVMLAGPSGFGELITTGNYDLLRYRNFGMHAIPLPATEETVLSQLGKYDPQDAAKVTDRVRRTEGLCEATARLVEIYETAIDEFRNRDCGNGDLLSSVAQFLDTIAPFANTFYVAERVVPLERKLRQISAAFSMQRMSARELSRLKMEVAACPRELEPGECGEALVRVRNGAKNAVSSLGEFPIHLSSHWYDRSGALVVFDGPRSELFPPLLPGQSYAYAVKIAAPSKPGRYVLRLTLVQEAVLWLDRRGVFCEAPCVVAARSTSFGATQRL